MKDDIVALIALGSNQGNSAQLIDSAFDELQQLSSTPIRKSSLWETLPVDCPPGSPPFVNAAVALIPKADETPETLLKQLQKLEKVFGRQKKIVMNEPRPLDLDLITFGHVVRRTPELTLPHPRAHQRRFVLQPLAEVAPDFILPGQMATVIALLELVSEQPEPKRVRA